MATMDMTSHARENRTQFRYSGPAVSHGLEQTYKKSAGAA